MTKETPMRLLGRIMVKQSIRMHEQGYQLGTVAMPIENDKKYTFNGAIETVQNTFNPDFFGAFLHFENLHLSIGKESATVNFIIVLPEVRSDYLIRDISVKFNSAKNYEGKDLKKFVSKIPKAIAEAWNEEY